MKALHLLIFVSLFLIVFSSCENECHDCTLSNVTETICESDYDSQNDFDDALASIESGGGFCEAN